MSAINSRNSIMSPQQLERLKAERKALEARLNNRLDVPLAKNEAGLSERKKGYFDQFIRKDVREDKDLIKRRLERVNAVIQRGSPPPLSKNERRKREDERKRDEEFLKQNLTPRALYYAKTNTPEFDRALKALKRENDPKFQRVIDRFVQNTRALDPDNDQRNIVERLRPTS